MFRKGIKMKTEINVLDVAEVVPSSWISVTENGIVVAYFRDIEDAEIYIYGD
jgi:hypothetical protein